jgi:hypothetical protein
VTGATTFVGDLRGAAQVWDYGCGCGQRYRVSVEDGETRFWAAKGRESFCSRPLVAPECVRCGAPLALR